MTNTASTDGELVKIIKLNYAEISRATKAGTDDMPKTLAAIHRYAATMAREELERYFDAFNDGDFTPMQTIEYCEQRIAALASPDGEMKGKS